MEFEYNYPPIETPKHSFAKQWFWFIVFCSLWMLVAFLWEYYKW